LLLATELARGAIDLFSDELTSCWLISLLEKDNYRGLEKSGTRRKDEI